MKMSNDIYKTMLKETAEMRDGKLWYSLQYANRAYATLLPDEPFVMVRRKSETTKCGFTFVTLPVVHMDSYFTERPARMENIEEITFDTLDNLKALHLKNIGVRE